MAYFGGWRRWGGYAAVLLLMLWPEALAGSRPILVVTAVDNEFTAVRADLTKPRDSLLGGRQVAAGQVDGAAVVVIRSGWGKAHAAGATAAAIQRFSPWIVVMAGTAGSLDRQSVVSGDVVLVDAAFQYDLGGFGQARAPVWPPENPLEQPYSNRHFLSDQNDLNKAAAALNAISFAPWQLRKGCACNRDGTLKPGCAGETYRVDREHPRVCTGTASTGDSFDMAPALASRMSSEHSAVAVDMETAAVAEEAADYRLPFIGIRVITDVVGDPDGANLYYCLKPLSGRRLGVVMKRVLTALASSSPAGAASACKTRTP